MNKMLLLSAILFTFQSFSQQPKYNLKELNEILDRGMHLPLNQNKKSQIISKDSLYRFFKKLDVPPVGELSLMQSNGNKVYTLPQDDMPCIFPDLSKTNYNMPILLNGIKITEMPSGPQAPFPIIPKEK